MAENSWLGTAQDALQGAVTGAAMGSVVPGVGTAIGTLAGLASGLVPHLASTLSPPTVNAMQPALAAAAQAITGKATEPEQVEALHADNDAMTAFRVQVMTIAAQQAAAADAAANASEAQRLADVANARATAVSLAQSGSGLAWGTPVVSLVVLVMFGVVLATVVLHGVPAGAETLLNVLLGTLAAMATNVVGYWVGSSAGSARKTKIASEHGAVL